MRGFIPPCAIDEAKQHTSIDYTSVRSPSQTEYELIVAEPDEGIDKRMAVVDLKVVMLGKEFCGKTSLVERYLNNRYLTTDLRKKILTQD